MITKGCFFFFVLKSHLSGSKAAAKTKLRSVSSSVSFSLLPTTDISDHSEWRRRWKQKLEINYNYKREPCICMMVRMWNKRQKSRTNLREKFGSVSAVRVCRFLVASGVSFSLARSLTHPTPVVCMCMCVCVYVLNNYPRYLRLSI